MKSMLLTLLAWLVLGNLHAHNDTLPVRTYTNPIIPGYYPDPSVCRVGDDYYLVTSSFESFPGVPIFHSRDLVHWQQLGHVLDRPSQLMLDSIPYSKGIYAPTIRYHQGVFYMITTLVQGGVADRKGNFIVTATNPAGPWSEPYFVRNAPGIDPSLFFDDDGRAYYTGNRVPATGEAYPKHRHIWLKELDLNTMQLVGEESIILAQGGALHLANNAEAPHLYKKDGYYYLVIAEGGTGDNHAVTVFRSTQVRGPYEPHKKNPIITNRHMGKDYPIQCIGHADLVQTQHGEWWAVSLGCRPYGGNYYNLARETFLIPMGWESGWPVGAPGIGHVRAVHQAPALEPYPFAPRPTTDHFADTTLGFEWNFLRTPRGNFWSLSQRPGFLRLALKPEMLTQERNPSFVGRRQQHINFEASTVMEFEARTPSESAGLVVYQAPTYHYRLERKWQEGSQWLVLTQCRDGAEHVLASVQAPGSRIYLKVEAQGQDYRFYYALQPNQWQLVAPVDGRILNRNTAGGFTGIYLGMYASGNGKPSTQVADFDYFEYKELATPQP